MTTRLAIALMILLVACGESSTVSQTTQAPSPPVPATRWVHAQAADESSLLRASGRWARDANARAELGVPPDARVLRVHVAVGQRVARGDALLSIVVPSAIEARGAKVAAEVRMEAYSERLQRLETLSREGLARGADVAELRMRVAEARASREEAASRIRAIERAGIALSGDDAQIRAPIDGVVVAMNASIGASPGAGAVTIVAEHGGRIEAKLPFAVHDGVRFAWVNDDGISVPLELVSQSPEADVADGTRAAWLRTASGEGIAGAPAVLRVIVDNAWVVPTSALVADGASTHVKTRAHGDVSVERVLSVGVSSVVRGALREGDFVAVAEGT